MASIPLDVLLHARLACTGQVLAPDPAALGRLIVLSPLLEEWVVRAGVQEWLIRNGQPDQRLAWLSSITLSTAVFGLLHLRAGAPAALRVMGPGLLIGLVYQYRRDWRWCALLHCAFNALALLACNF